MELDPRYDNDEDDHNICVHEFSAEIKNNDKDNFYFWYASNRDVRIARAPVKTTSSDAYIRRINNNRSAERGNSVRRMNVVVSRLGMLQRSNVVRFSRFA